MSKSIIIIFCFTLLFSCNEEANKDSIRFIIIRNQSVNANHFSNEYNILRGEMNAEGMIEQRYFQFLDTTRFNALADKIYQLEKYKILSDTSCRDINIHDKISQLIIYKYYKNDTFYLYDLMHRQFKDSMSIVREFKSDYLW